MSFITPRITGLIKAMEGFSDKSYVDASGRSIGYGHFIKPGENLEGKSLSQEDAEKLLESDIKKHQDPWIGKLKKDVGEETIAALTSFAYNAGAHGQGINKAVELINAGKIEEAAEHMQQYNKSKEGGVLSVNKALVERRAFEKKLLLGGKTDSDLASKWHHRGSFTANIKRLFSDDKRQPRESSYNGDGNSSTNATVLQGLRELNATLGKAAAEEEQERAWAARVLEEGKGWPAY